MIPALLVVGGALGYLAYKKKLNFLCNCPKPASVKAPAVAVAPAPIAQETPPITDTTIIANAPTSVYSPPETITDPPVPGTTTTGSV